MHFLRQDKCECAMDIGHVAVLFALGLLARHCMHIVRQDLSECAIDIRHVGLLLALRVLARQ